MLVSHKSKFIFFKTIKTASSSVFDFLTTLRIRRRSAIAFECRKERKLAVCNTPSGGDGLAPWQLTAAGSHVSARASGGT